jgi:hypothetical protein
MPEVGNGLDLVARCAQSLQVVIVIRAAIGQGYYVI